MTNATTLMPDERTDYEKGPELASRVEELVKTITDKDAEIAELRRTLRSVLSVIDAMQAPAGCEDRLNSSYDERTVNPQHCFGTGDEGCDLIEWPDLSWAKDQIVKALAS